MSIGPKRFRMPFYVSCIDLNFLLPLNGSSHIPTLDFQGREKLGLQCKRLLDVGRVRYLKENGFDAELVYYVDKETSLENLALMAVPSSLSS